MNKISANDLRPNDCFFVRGNVMYSRIASKTTNEEREAENAHRNYPIDKNYTTMRICNAQVIPNPANPQITEYAQQHCYKSTSAATNGTDCFSGINKGDRLPNVYVKNSVTGKYDGPITLDGELANGLDVTIAMRVFATKGKNGRNGNNGVTLAQVYVNEPLRTYQGNKADTAVNEAAMQSLGITFSAPTPNMNNGASDNGTAAPQQYQQPAPAPAPQPQYQQPQYQQAQPQQYQQPAPAPAPAPQPQYQQAPQAQQGNIFNANNGASPFVSSDRQY